jgi:S1-C subfamily serine protease
MNERPSIFLPPGVSVAPPAPPTPPPTSELPATPPPDDPPAPRGSGVGPRLVALLVVLALAAGGVAGAVTASLLDDDEPAPAAQPSDTAAGEPILSAGGAIDVPALVERVGPSVVAIQAEVAGRFGGAQRAAGSGVVLTADGEILTNAHVVEGATTIRVTVAGEARSRDAHLIGLDRDNDVALIKVDGVDSLVPARLGSTDDVRVGDEVIAIGNALGLRGGPSVTRGIVSALGRSVETRFGTITGLIQTDASISSGNSGGPLVDARGRVIGINTAVATSNLGQAVENIGFAIDIDRAMEVVERLRQEAPTTTQARPRAYLGVTVSDPTDGSRGALITAVEPDSPAEGAGLRAGDLVTAVDDRRIDDAASLVDAIRRSDPDDEVRLTIVGPDREERQVTVRLGSRAT